MNGVGEFKVGSLYTNDQIRFSLDVENLGGIRPGLDAKRGGVGGVLGRIASKAVASIA